MFHACPPAGTWMNDPNALVHADGAWRLFVQHRDDAPAFRATGWARLSSVDGLRWRFDGQVIRPDAEWAYSGSIRAGAEGLVATHTAHDAVTGLERQVVRRSSDAGLNWSDPVSLTYAARDVRDPFVCPDGALLLARPCGWDSSGESSQLGIWREGSEGWREAGRIGPWHPPGVMWEVPVLARVDGRDLLLISTVNRRGGRADCTVQGWVGTLTHDSFVRDADWPAAGRRVDLGPDFYAGITASDGRVVAWLSSWATARIMPWPEFAGGPISLPRRLSIDGNRIRHSADEATARAFTASVADVPVAGRGTAVFDGGSAFELRLAGSSANALIVGQPVHGSLSIRRTAAPPLGWSGDYDEVITPCPVRTLKLYVDGPAVELFIEPDGCAISVAVPVGDAGLDISLKVGGKLVLLNWKVLSISQVAEPSPTP